MRLLPVSLTPKNRTMSSQLKGEASSQLARPPPPNLLASTRAGSWASPDQARAALRGKAASTTPGLERQTQSSQPGLRSLAGCEQQPQDEEDRRVHQARAALRGEAASTTPGLEQTRGSCPRLQLTGHKAPRAEES